MQATVRYAFEKLALPRLVALIQPANAASIRVAEKAGLRHRRETVYEGEAMRLYEITSGSGHEEADGVDHSGDPSP